MKRRILIAALALGAVLGFGSGFYSLARHHGHGCHGSQEARWDGYGRWGDGGGAYDGRGPRDDDGAAYRARIERLERHVADLEAAVAGRPAVSP